MKPRAISIVLALAAPVGAADAPPKAAPAAPGVSSLAALPPSPLATRMKQVHATLEEIFKVREPGSPIPDLRQNPFQIPGAAAATAQAQTGNSGGRAGTPAPETEPGQLRRLASSLSFGFVEKPGSAPIVTIGNSSYKEGETYRMTDAVNNTQVGLRIKKISGKSVTFGLGNSEFTVTK